MESLAAHHPVFIALTKPLWLGVSAQALEAEVQPTHYHEMVIAEKDAFIVSVGDTIAALCVNLRDLNAGFSDDD